MGKKLYGAVDLHSNNGVYDIRDGSGKCLWHRRLRNDLESVLRALEPFRRRLTSFAIESTYNWYWLADGLAAAGYATVLANPSAMHQYSGLKDADDDSDAAFMTELMRTGILPTGWICPAEDRALRDLLRRRLLIVNSRTTQMLSVQSMLSRQTGRQYSWRAVAKLPTGELQQLLGDENLYVIARAQLTLIAHHSEAIGELEATALRQCKPRPEYGLLTSVPGIGKILAMTIMLEVGTIDRFPSAGDFSSYCRACRAGRSSNNKPKGNNNRRNGNRYLGWAFVEAVNHAIRVCPAARKWYRRKEAKTNATVARKALCSKWSKAIWYMLTNRQPFQLDKVFG
jgi:transposase